jgi:hypothetical protein
MSKQKAKRGCKRLVFVKDSTGNHAAFVDSNVGGHHQVQLRDGEVVTATTHTRTPEDKARRSHRFSALGRAR